MELYRFLSEREEDFSLSKTLDQDTDKIILAFKDRRFWTDYEKRQLILPVNGNIVNIESLDIKFNIIVQNGDVPDTQNGEVIQKAFASYENKLIYFYIAWPLRDFIRDIGEIMERRKSTLIHEIRHLIQLSKSKGAKRKKDEKKSYLARQSEIDAYFIEALTKMNNIIIESFKKSYFDLWKDELFRPIYDDREDFIRTEGPYMSDPIKYVNELYRRFLVLYKDTRQEYSETEKVKKYIQKRAYSNYTKLIEYFVDFMEN